MDKNKNMQLPGKRDKLTGAFYFQPVTHPSEREEKTNRAIPSDRDVADNREWVQHNKK